MSFPNPEPVMDLIDAFRRSKAMFTAVSLGVFDLLEEAPAGANELARRIQANPEALSRLLDACVGLGLLCREHGLYANTPVAQRYLCRGSAHTLAGYILYSDEVLFRLWANLDDAVREGTHRWTQTFGADAASLFDHFFHSDDSMRTFLQGMHGLGMMSSPGVVAAFNLGRFHRLVDLGGASGHLVAAACERYPKLTGVVFDLPRVTKAAGEYIARSAAYDRIELAPGDFFQDELPAADLYAVGRILHDWSEEKIHRLLKRIHARLPAGGGLLIAERLLEEDRSGPSTAHLQSLNMLCCTEGRERTLSEYVSLLSQAGFAKVRGKRTGTPLDAVLAIKN